MTLRRRIDKLTQRFDARHRLTDAERVRRISYLLEYRGDDRELLWRQERLRELMEQWRRKYLGPNRRG